MLSVCLFSLYQIHYFFIIESILILVCLCVETLFKTGDQIPVPNHLEMMRCQRVLKPYSSSSQVTTKAIFHRTETNQTTTKTYPRNDTLSLPDAPHLRCVQNEGSFALDLLAEAVRVQNLEMTDQKH